MNHNTQRDPTLEAMEYLVRKSLPLAERRIRDQGHTPERFGPSTKPHWAKRSTTCTTCHGDGHVNYVGHPFGPIVDAPCKG